MKELVYEDPHLAFQVALEIRDRRNRVGSEAQAIEEIAKFDTELAISLLPSTRDIETKLHAAREVGVALIQDGDSAGAKEIAELLPQSDRADYFLRLMGRWALYDPSGLFELISDLPSDEVKESAAASLLAQHQFNDEVTFSNEEQEELQSYLPNDENPRVQPSSRELRDFEFVDLRR